MIVAHDDNGKSHLHVMANLVDPENGTRITVGNDWRKMDAWATEYAEARGWLHLTPKRAERASPEEIHASIAWRTCFCQGALGSTASEICLT